MMNFSINSGSSLILFLILNAFYYPDKCNAQETYFPDAVWKHKSAEDVNLNPVLLDSVITLAVQNENTVEKDLRISNLRSYANEPGYKILGPMKQRGGPAGIVLKNGYIIAEWGDVSRVDMTFSVTKSYLSTIAGLAVDQGLIKSVDDEVASYVWDEYFEGEHNRKITWKQLLQQSSDWSGSLFGLHDWADRPPSTGGIDSWKQRKLNEPGTVFEYNDVRVNILSYALLQVWRKPLPMVLKDKIMDPIGASTTWRWMGYDNAFVNLDGMMVQSVSGGGHHGGGIFINTLDMARFGLLFSRNGKWKNTQLISSAWIKDATKPSIPEKKYGYMWWLNTDQSWKSASPSVYYAAGYGGNYIIVDKENDLVIVLRWANDKVINDIFRLLAQTSNKK